jgi:hypothetical protein
MANWCLNRLEFKGDAEQINALEKLFKVMAHREVKTRHGQLPDFVSVDSGYFFEIIWCEDAVEYVTRWCPNVEVVKIIGRHLNVDYAHHYQEPAMGIYGSASLNAGVFQQIDLEPQDLMRYEFDEESEGFCLDGKFYQYEDEVIEVLLLRKEQEKRSNQS